jgi:plastocyanin
MRTAGPLVLRRLVGTAVALLTAGVFISGCGSSGKPAGGGASSVPAGGSPVVHVKNFSFDPQKLTVRAGTKVTWEFDDSAQHTVTASNNAFKSGDLSSGATYSTVFNTAGTYSYLCSIHQYMTGTVIVTTR